MWVEFWRLMVWFFCDSEYFKVHWEWKAPWEGLPVWRGLGGVVDLFWAGINRRNLPGFSSCCLPVTWSCFWKIQEGEQEINLFKNSVVFFPQVSFFMCETGSEWEKSPRRKIIQDFFFLLFQISFLQGRKTSQKKIVVLLISEGFWSALNRSVCRDAASKMWSLVIDRRVAPTDEVGQTARADRRLLSVSVVIRLVLMRLDEF